MTNLEAYGRYQIHWRETGERFVALLRTTANEEPPAVITASVSEGMAVLKARTFAIVDAGTVEAYRPNLSGPNDASPVDAFASFLRSKEQELGEPLCLSSGPERLTRGWAFWYQSRAFVQTAAIDQMLVGNGPVVVADNGRVLEGGSLDRDPEEILARNS